jgi:hypothetical protein
LNHTSATEKNIVKITASDQSVERTSIAYFISPHGFGHAARASAVIEAIHRIKPEFSFHLFTTVPAWFFQDSLTAPFTYHSVETDIGLVQKSPFQEDIHATLHRLDRFLPFAPSLIENLTRTVIQQDVKLILCDISPLGIAVSHAAEIPSVLIENFTWDWIYEGYADVVGSMDKHIRYLRQVFDTTDYHVQAEPVCLKRSTDLTTLPVSRKFRLPVKEIRRQLQLPNNRKMVLITTGGIASDHRFINRLGGLKEIFFVIPGASSERNVPGNVTLMPHRSSIYHPDLVNASDAVVGKTGYSTLAEVYAAGVPFGFVSRSDFRESLGLNKFIKNEMTGIEVGVDKFENGSWLTLISELVKLPRRRPRRPNGADQIAEFICNLNEIGDKKE